MHESIHATDKENIEQSIENGISKSKANDVERLPKQIEDDALRELFYKNRDL